MTPQACLHQDREPAGDGLRARCQDCGRVFLPRGAPVEHGTYRGYSRHSKKRAGQWSWPPCSPCAEAGRQWRKEYEERPGTQKGRRRRNAARSEALVRLRRRYPGEYAALYVEELRLRGGEVVRREEVPVWDGILARLVKAATGYDEARAAVRVREGRAGPAEIEVIRQVSRLRALLAGITREAPHDA